MPKRLYNLTPLPPSFYNIKKKTIPERNACEVQQPMAARAVQGAAVVAGRRAAVPAQALGGGVQRGVPAH